MIFDGEFGIGGTYSPIGTPYATNSILTSKLNYNFDDGGTLSGWFCIDKYPENTEIVLLGNTNFNITIRNNNNSYTVVGKLNTNDGIIEIESNEITYDEWYYICISKTYKELTLYINGMNEIRTSLNNIPRFDNESVYLRNIEDDGYIVEFININILEYGISTREAYNISQGLVCHLDYTDAVTITTLNLASKALLVDNVGGLAKVTDIENGYIIDIPENNNDNVVKYYFEMGCQTHDNIFTLSANITNLGDTDISVHANIMSLENSDINVGENKFVHGTCNANSTSYQLQIRSVDNSPIKVKVEYLQLEEQDHYTNYTPDTRIVDLELWDTSGMGNDFEFANDMSVAVLSSDVLGSKSLLLDNTTITNSTMNKIEGEFAIALWVKHVGTTQVFDYCNNVVNISIDDNSSLCMTMLDIDNKEHSLLYQIELNTWTHVALCFDGVNMMMYVDGVMVNSMIVNKPIYSDIEDPIFTIGGGYLEIADFRYYCFALHEDDFDYIIKTPFVIDNNGSLEVLDIEENEDNIFTIDNLMDEIDSEYVNVELYRERNDKASYVINPKYFYKDGLSKINIFKNHFTSGRYVFDLYVDVDDGFDGGYYGGIIVNYTDGTVDELTVVSKNGNDGFQHIYYVSREDKVISSINFKYDSPFNTYYSWDTMVVAKSKMVSFYNNSSKISTSQIIEHNDDLQLQQDGRLKLYKIIKKGCEKMAVLKSTRIDGTLDVSKFIRESGVKLEDKYTTISNTNSQISATSNALTLLIEQNSLALSNKITESNAKINIVEEEVETIKVKMVTATDWDGIDIGLE